MLKIAAIDGIVIITWKNMKVNKLDCITFSEIMEFYPKHNHSVYEELRDACRRGSIIPFVGAGLSVFCGYQGWPDVLKELAGFVYDPDTRANIEMMIKNGELLQAAQEIQNNYPLILKELRKMIDYDKIKNCDQVKLHDSAAYVLPYLFNSNMVMTTNFDRVLEEVYDRCHTKFGKIITPYEPDLLTQSRQDNPHCLFKLHGDIGPEIHDIERLIFTQTQYDRAYASDGSLMQELPQWFQSKKLLFLGCSLAKDKTMDVLQQVTSKNPGLDHYAILACPPNDIAKRCVEMGNWGISAIYYPAGRHEAVRVILERLLEDINYSAYEELRSHTKKTVSTSKTVNRFMYDSDYIAFEGRKQEFSQLQEFCQDNMQVSWWAVTGPGGMGKSRLVYEFTNAQKAAGWKICWLRHSDYDNLGQWTPPVDRCIVVADDVQAHLQTIGHWIISISSRQRSEKLRIILLERDGEDLNSARWAELLQADSPYDDTISAICYRSDFLNLPPLSDDELKAIMMDFAKASAKPLADSGYADRLLRTFKKIDGGLQRPIYALAITDGWCGGKDPTRWSKEQILDALVKRELEFYYNRLRSLSSDEITKAICSELENMLARSCIASFLPLAHIGEDEYPKLHKRADKLDLTFPELLRQIGIVHEIEVHFQIQNDAPGNPVTRKEIIEAIVLDCPDMIKEYLVLRQAFGKNRFSLLLPEDWDSDPLQLFFLRQILIDYPEKLEENNQFWTAFFTGDPKSEVSAQIYGNLLFGTAVQLPKMEKQALDRLEKLYCDFHDSEDIVVAYAKGVFNLSINQALEDRTHSVDKLRLLYEQIPTSEDLAALYAKGLVNLSVEQTLEDRTHSVDKLRLLYGQISTSEELAALYAKGLVNLSAIQTLENCTHSIDNLKMLYEQISISEELAALYAKGLVNLSIKQTLGDRARSVDRLRLLYKQIPTSEELAVVYMKGLVNLTVEQTLEDCVHSVDKLRLLYEQTSTSEELAVEYAKGLVSLSIKQTLEDCTHSVDKLRLLYEQSPTNESLTVEYASGLVNLSLKQTKEADVRESTQQAKQLLSKHPQNAEIQLSYAQTLFNLTLKQESVALHRTAAQIREFLLAHHEANQGFQDALDTYLNEHPDHMERYTSLRV